MEAARREDVFASLPKPVSFSDITRIVGDAVQVFGR
jgi:hypothetical protein